MASDTFEQIFQRCGSTTQRWLLARSLLTGVTVACTSAAAWMFGHWLAPQDVPALGSVWQLQRETGLSILAWAGVTLAGVVPVLLAWLRRPNAERLALYFDRRLESKQCVVSALDPAHTTSFTGPLRKRAARLLTEATPARLRPRLLRRWHWLLPLTAVCILVLSRLPDAPTPGLPLPAGSRLLQVHALNDFEPLLNLQDLPALSEADEKALRELSNQARELRDQLELGVTQRKAMSALARMQDTVAEQLRPLSSAPQDPGLQAAVAALRDNPTTAGAAEALMRGDLQQFDQEMRRLSSAEERASRQEARAALAQARAAARPHASQVANRLLSEQLSAFDSRADASEQIRNLLRLTKLEPSVVENAPSAVQQRRLSSATPSEDEPRVDLQAAERTRLAERLQAGLERGTFDFTAEDLKQMQGNARASDSPTGQSPPALPALAETLRRHAEPSPLLEHQQALLNADRALTRLQHALADRPLPLPSANGAAGESRESRPGPDDAQASAGRSRSPGDHQGSTNVVDAMELHAKTTQALDFERGVFTSSKGRSNTAHVAPPSASQLGVLSAVGPAQIESVQRTEIPVEYREQVSRYFSGD